MSTKFKPFRESVKNQLFRGHIIYQVGGGGGAPLPLKKGDFFKQNVKNIPHALKKSPPPSLNSG